MCDLINNSQLRIVAAPWIITMTGPAVKDGGVLLDGEKILEVGKLASVTEAHPGIGVEFFPGALIPALVNAHMHLELSHLPKSSPLSPEKHFVDWVEELLAKRMSSLFTVEEVQTAALLEIEQQFESGVVFIGDIGNASVSEHSIGNNAIPEIYYMEEMLGSSADAVLDALQKLQEKSPVVHLTAHAPYSTRPELIKKIKERCDQNGHIFSIHTAEVGEERDFISSDSGIFHDFLIKRGSWSDDFFSSARRASTTVEYLDKLGVLNNKTLLVHCVHVSLSDIKRIKHSGAQICVCPCSNSFLHAGRAPIEEMLMSDIIPAIGTDSWASNHILDMWEEIRLVHQNYPSIKPTDILKMATTAGARAFGKDHMYGEISPGKSSCFLHVNSDEIKNCTTEADLLKMLVVDGRPENIEWIQQTFMKSRDN